MPASRIYTGMWVNAEWQRVTALEKQLGIQPLDFVRIANGMNGWDDIQNSPEWFAKRFAPSGHQYQLMLKFIPQSVPAAQGYREIAEGKHDDKIRNTLTKFIRACPGQWKIPTGIFYENNGGWMPYSVQKSFAPDAKRAIARVSKIMKEVSPRFLPMLVFAEWDNKGAISFEDIWNPDIQDLGMNLYTKQEYQKDKNGRWSPGATIEAFKNSHSGLNQMLREAKKLGVKGVWIPELGLRPHEKDGAQREQHDLTQVVDFVSDWLHEQAQHFERVGVLLWSGRSASEAYVDPTGTGKFPKVDAALTRMFKRIEAYNAGRPVTPVPSPQPQPAPLPVPQPTPQPSTPASPEADLLRRIHEGAYAERVRNPQTKLAPVEHIAWASRTGAPDGKPTMQALLAAYRLLEDGDALSAAERAIAMPWMVEAEDLLEAAGLLQDEPTPQPQEPVGEVEALRAQVAALSQALEEAKAGRNRAEAQLAAVRAALAA